MSKTTSTNESITSTQEEKNEITWPDVKWLKPDESLPPPVDDGNPTGINLQQFWQQIERQPRFGFDEEGNVIPVPFVGSKRNVTIIAAMTIEQGLGLNDAIPWTLNAHTAQFELLTMGQVVIMGRKTWYSIPGGYLKGRRNIVITNHPEDCVANRWVNGVPVIQAVKSMEEALTLAGNQQIFIIGGAQIYNLAMPYVNDMIITTLKMATPCDTFFPLMDDISNFHYPVLTVDHDKAEGISYAFSYQRRRETEMIEKKE